MATIQYLLSEVSTVLVVITLILMGLVLYVTYHLDSLARFTQRLLEDERYYKAVKKELKIK